MLLKKRIKQALENLQLRYKDIHGHNEYGIDLIFEKPDIWGISRKYGIQLKSKDIKCSKNRVSSDVKEIIGQLAIAFGHEFLFYEEKIYLDAAYVITDKEINYFAECYIKEAWIGIRKIYCIYGRKLDKFLRENAPAAKISKKT